MDREIKNPVVDAALSWLYRWDNWSRTRQVAYQTTFSNQEVRVTLRYLRRLGYVEKDHRGYWGLTPAGKKAAPSWEKSAVACRRAQDAAAEARAERRANPQPPRSPAAPRPPRVVVATFEEILKAGRSGVDLFGVNFIKTGTTDANG